MTPADMDHALKAAGLGWAASGGLTTSAAAGGGRCNTIGCASFAAIANEAGLTADQIMPSLIAEAGDPLSDPPVAPDSAALRGHIANKKDFRSTLAAHDLSWSAEGGVINVWQSGDRSTEVQPRWVQANVTTQSYFAQAAIAGASHEGMASALANYVAGDSTAFDLIMAA